MMHSSWTLGMSDTHRLRRKTTAKASRGLHTSEEVLTPAAVLDIADYSIYVGCEVEEFMLQYGKGAEV